MYYKYQYFCLVFYFLRRGDRGDHCLTRTAGSALLSGLTRASGSTRVNRVQRSLVLSTLTWVDPCMGVNPGQAFVKPGLPRLTRRPPLLRRGPSGHGLAV